MVVDVDPSRVRIGWIGTGVMGLNMAMHCLRKGYKNMVAYNRTTSKVDRLVEMGAKLATSPADVAKQSDVLFSMVGFPGDVRDILLHPTNGVLANMQSGGVVVDLTTSEPSLAVEIAASASTKGLIALDAPVSGGDVGARNGTLSVLVGGDSQTVEAVRPILDCFAGSITYFGLAGAGQHAKAANQITICTNMIGMCEGLMYAHAAGLDLEKYLTAISRGGASSFSLNAYAPRILKGDLQPGFYVEHFVKDLGIAVVEAQRMGLSLPGLGLAHQLYLSLVASGDARLGTQALVKVFEKLNNRSLPSITVDK